MQSRRYPCGQEPPANGGREQGRVRLQLLERVRDPLRLSAVVRQPSQRNRFVRAKGGKGGKGRLRRLGQGQHPAGRGQLTGLAQQLGGSASVALAQHGDGDRSGLSIFRGNRSSRSRFGLPGRAQRQSFCFQRFHDLRKGGLDAGPNAHGPGADMRYPGGRRFQAAVSRVNAQILGFADAHVGLSRPPQPGNGWETQRVTPFAQGHNRRQRSFPLKAPRFGQLDGLKTAVRNLPLCGVYHAGSIQHGRHHRADLPGLAVYRPAAAEDQIKPAQRRLGLCQTVSRHQRVRARKSG